LLNDLLMRSTRWASAFMYPQKMLASTGGACQKTGNLTLRRPGELLTPWQPRAAAHPANYPCTDLKSTRRPPWRAGGALLPPRNLPTLLGPEGLSHRFPVQPLKHNWKDFAYTEGSAIKEKDPATGAFITKTGAGVYFPCEGEDSYGLSGALSKGRLITINTGAPGYTKTITRAELVALLHVLRCTAGEREHLPVATDSLAAMHLIHSIIHRPHNMWDHKHRSLLYEIYQEIEVRTQPLRL
jgi:hypothetical protein